MDSETSRRYVEDIINHDCEKCQCYNNCKTMCLSDTIMAKCIFYHALKEKIRSK